MNFNNFENYDDDDGWNGNAPGDFGDGPEQDYYEEMDYDNHQFNNFRGEWRGGSRGRGFNKPFQGPPRNMPPPPGFPGYAWGRGFGPFGPPIQGPRGNSGPIKYLLRCGVPRDLVKGLPRNILQLIQPEYCGVCDIQLGSFQFSRAHYTSKGHLKHHKKNLMPRDMGFKRPKTEIPLKSRDLYCELCNVHITSKAHAESHYAGKPHRAIVEGRKPPKNAYLHGRGMTSRVEQLIRREKKFIKPLPEEPKTEDETAEPKPIQPELFCEICKTSVTCTEQMTMHLNGKRHLAKEKQHILQMMKGDAESGDKQNVEEEASKEGDEDPEAQEEEEEKNDEGDKYDWGNGSGAWEDNAQ